MIHRQQLVQFTAILFFSFQGMPGPAAQQKEEAALAELVQQSQKAGQEKHDLAKWLAPWARDAKIIGGRSEKPGMYDVVLTWPQIKAHAEIRYSGSPSKKVSMTFENVQVQIQDDKAVLRYRAVVKTPDSTTRADEIYLLRKTQTGWEIYENRWWPVHEIYKGKEIQFDAKTWQKLDAEVDQKRKNKDLLGEALALIEAYRFTEAYTVSKELTKQRPQEAIAWLLRGFAAFESGHAPDALTSFQQTLVLDPTAEVPDYVRKALKVKK